MKKIIIDTFKYIFSDREWFNKIFVGGCYLLLIPLGIGFVMLNGFLVEFMHLAAQKKDKMPYWRNAKSLLRSGWKISLALFVYYSIAAVIILFSGTPFLSLNSLFLFLVLEFIISPILLLTYEIHGTFESCFDAKIIGGIIVRNWKMLIPSLVFSSIFISMCVLFGWMWIVAGWTLLIFLSLLVQNGMNALLSVHS